MISPMYRPSLDGIFSKNFRSAHHSMVGWSTSNTSFCVEQGDKGFGINHIFCDLSKKDGAGGRMTFLPFQPFSQKISVPLCAGESIRQAAMSEGNSYSSPSRVTYKISLWVILRSNLRLGKFKFTLTISTLSTRCVVTWTLRSWTSCCFGRVGEFQ